MTKWSDDSPTALVLQAESPARRRSLCDCTVVSISPPGGRIALITIVGDLDIVSTPMVTYAVDSALALSPSHLVVDVGHLGFCGAEGLSCLVRVDRAAVGCGIHSVFSGMSPQLAARWSRLGAGTPLPARRPSAADAVTAAMGALRRQPAGSLT